MIWVWVFPFRLQGKAGDTMALSDYNDAAGYPLFTFVDENIFKKETFLGKCVLTGEESPQSDFIWLIAQ